jgi:hypothetical protein
LTLRKGESCESRDKIREILQGGTCGSVGLVVFAIGIPIAYSDLPHATPHFPQRWWWWRDDGSGATGFRFRDFRIASEPEPRVPQSGNVIFA